MNIKPHWLIFWLVIGGSLLVVIGIWLVQLFAALKSMM